MTPLHMPCPKCGSKNNLAIFENGSEKCFTPDCNHWSPPKNKEMKLQTQESTSNTKSLSIGELKPITDRNISESTCEKYGTTLNGTKHYYPYFDNEGQHVANKVRNTEKKAFFSEGKIQQAGLFGQQAFREKGKYITLCEGEVDAMSAYQMLGSKFSVVSIRNGAASVANDIADSYDYLMSYDNIIISFDNDEAGKKAAVKAAEMLSPKAKIMPLRFKDANDYLLKSKQKQFVEDWWEAKTHTPDGIISGKNMWDIINKGVTEAAVNYPFQGLQKLTYGLRQGELVTLTAGSGLGKSQFVRELIWHIFKNTPDNIGMMFMEESVKRSGLSIMSLDADKPLHIPEIFNNTSKEEFKKYFDNTLGTERLFFYDHFGSNTVDSIVSRIRYFGKVLHCKYVVLDHVSIIVSDQQNGDERRALDEIMTKIRTVVQELDICLIMVSHLRRPSTAGHEEGAATSLSQLRGSASIGQLSDIVIGLERNGQHDDERERHTTTVRVIKNRFSGLTGPACRVFYNLETGRLSEVEEEFE